MLTFSGLLYHQRKTRLMSLTHVLTEMEGTVICEECHAPDAGFTTVQLRPSDQTLCDECWRKRKDPVDKPLFSSDEEKEGLDENLLTTKSIQTENGEDQSQQEDVPRKGEAEPVDLVGGGNKNKENKDGETVKTVCVKCTKRVQKGTNCEVCKNYIISSVTELLKNK